MEELAYNELVTQNAKLEKIQGLLQNLLDLEAAAIPEVFRSYTFPVEEKTRMIDSSAIPTFPWISCVISNDGDSVVYVFINEVKNIREQDIMDDSLQALAPVKYAPILVGESKTYNMGFSGIRRLYFRCNEGDESQIRIFSAGKRRV